MTTPAPDSKSAPSGKHCGGQTLVAAENPSKGTQGRSRMRKNRVPPFELIDNR
jgi:hypothetical protein